MSQIPRPITTSKRPSEIVRTYIETEFFRSGMKANTRLPTIHEFSRHLNVSPSTVRSVFNALSKEGKLETIPGKGTFLTEQTGGEAREEVHNCIGVSVMAGPDALGKDTRGWGGSIFLGAMEEALRSRITITTLGGIHKEISRVDGVIAFPVDDDHTHQLDRACEEKKLPMVHINPTYFHATGNFVSNDFFKFAYHLALAWRETGRRRVVLVIGSSVNLSVSAAQITAAFSLAYAGCADARVDILEDPLGGVGASEDEPYYRRLGHALMTKHLKQHGVKDVDAVYGFGDWTAEGAVHALREAGRSVPEEVSVVGGTGMNAVDFDFGALVTMRQPMKKIGQTAVRMLLWRIQNQLFDTPGVYLMPELGKGATLRAEERKAYLRLLGEEKELV